MKLRALSHYDGDKDTRFGDCIDNQLEQLNTEFSKVLAEASECGDQAAYSDRFRDIMQKKTAFPVIKIG